MMKGVFDIGRVHERPSFSPPHHAHTTNWKLIDESAGARKIALWYSEMGQEGQAEPHVHDEMEQIFIILEGEGFFRIGNEEVSVKKGNVVFIPSGETHQMAATGDKTFKYLLVWGPPPQSSNPWEKQRSK